MLWGDKRGAVAPIVAISLFALIAAGGLAFDYARMAAMDTELQNAADQATLAAAAQLDKGTGACARASAAAVNFVQNRTLMANDAPSRAVTVTAEPTCDAVGVIRFYRDKAKTQPATGDADANFVEVTVNARTARFAFTPIVAAFNSGAIAATAFAGMGSAVCGVAPLMMCNPDEPETNNDVNYPFSIGNRIGIGIELVDDEQDVPGNFGFLDSGLSGASGLREVLSNDAQVSNCLSLDGVVTKPGFNASVMDAINTRFDIVSSQDCPGGPCSPSINARKDLVRGNACNWNEPLASSEEMDAAADDASPNPNPPRYRPTGPNALDPSKTPVIMGFPRDICHAWGLDAVCNGDTAHRLGDGNWDRAAYFRSNHPGLDWQNTAGLGPNVTRYQTYIWEAQDAANRLQSKDTLNSPVRTAYSTPQAGKCRAPGLMPTAGGPDRRLVTAAILNCHAYAIRGKKPSPVLKWVDLFLVEPAFDRWRCDDSNLASGCKVKYTDKREVYVELVAERDTPAFGGNNTTIFRRDVPYLIE